MAASMLKITVGEETCEKERDIERAYAAGEPISVLAENGSSPCRVIASEAALLWAAVAAPNQWKRRHMLDMKSNY